MIDAFLGNEPVVARLEEKLRSGRMPHGLIFSGPDGVGKRTFALRLIQAMNCVAETVPACGECNACRRIGLGTHPDASLVTTLDDATQIKIEQIRAIRESVELTPAEGRVRAWIIDPAERMSPGAANALLKVLEEPPAHARFFLITANEGELLVTIRSRCQVYHFAPPGPEIVRQLGVDDELVARWSAGSLGWIRRTDAAELRRTRDEMLAFLAAGLSGDPAALAERIGQRIADSRDEYRDMLHAACVLISDLMYLRLGLGDKIVNVDVGDRLRNLAAETTTARLVAAAGQLRTLESQLKSNLNMQLMTDHFLTSLGPGRADADHK